MLPTSGVDYLTEKRFEDARIVTRRAERKAMIEKVCASSLRYGPLGRVLNRLCAFLGWVHLRD